MSLHEVSLASMVAIEDGKIALLFDRLVESAVRDCHNRPAVKTKRKVDFAVEITPVLDDDGECRDVNIVVDTLSKLPRFKSREIVCQVRRREGKMTAVFNDMSPDNPDQMTIDE